MIHVIDEPDMSYEYHTLVVWEKAQRLFWAEDSGCSCPTPFEDYNLANLNKLNKRTYKEFDAALSAFENPPYGQAVAADEIAKVRHDIKTRLRIFA